jgi:hypothetical protein
MSTNTMQNAESEAQPADDDTVNQGHDDDTKTLFRDLVKMVNSLEARVDDLEAQLDQNNDEIIDRVMTRVNEQIEEEQKQRSIVTSKLRGNLQDEIADVRNEIQHEQQTRSQADSQLRARMTLVEEEMDGDIDEATLIERDKLTRIIKNGVEDVKQSPSKSNERAEDVLKKLDDWGSFSSDANGDRIVLYAKEVRDYMRERYGNSKIQSVQAQRAFDSIVEFAKDSPRRVKKRKGDDRSVQLVVYKPGQLVEAAEGVSA